MCFVVARRQPCDRDVTWNSGALHYSDSTELVMELVDLNTKRADLKAAIDRITYIGKGTYTDCAIKDGIAELRRAYVHLEILYLHTYINTHYH